MGAFLMTMILGVKLIDARNKINIFETGMAIKTEWLLNAMGDQ